MTGIKIQIGENPNPISWSNIIKAIYHNLGERAADNVIHFAVDVKSGFQVLDGYQPNYEDGLIIDLALQAEITSAYPESDLENLDDLLFIRAFCLDTTNVGEITSWINELFFDSAQYIWVNGEMVGGICFPQQSTSEDEFPPLKEKLSEEICLVR